MKKLLCVMLFVVMVLGTLVACDNGMIPNPDNGGNNENSAPKEDVITVEDGYLVVNGKKTEHKVDADDVIDVIDGYLVVNGVKTEYKVDDGKEPENKEDVITAENGYLVVNGNKTEYQVKTDDVIEIIDGYVVVNGVKTDIFVPTCNHSWTTVTTKPTCTAVGYDTLTCSLCGKSVVENETAKLDHTYSTTYSFDDNNHWFKCTGCDAKKDTAVHTPDADNNCTVCGTPLAATPGIIYDISADGTYAEVIGYEGTATKVKIASEYKGLPVKNIYNNAFEGNRSINDVIIPDSVTNIGDKAFYYCTSLSKVVFSESIINIGDSAFQHCAGITNIVIPDSVITIGKYAFASGYAPSVKSSLESVIIGDGVISIGERAFDYCDSLISVVIGNSVTSIGNNAFYNCTSLNSVMFGDSVTSIGEYAFANCVNLVSFVLPDSLAIVSRDAFKYCPSAFYSEYEDCKYFGSSDNPYAVLIEVTNKNLSGYTIHKDTQVISYAAFESCSRLTSITIPDNVAGVGACAFSNCSSLTSIVIGDSVTSVDGGAFSNCSSLTSIVIGDSVTSIGAGAFSNCSSLKDVCYTGSKEEWNAIVIDSMGNYNLTNATIHYNYVPEE